MYMKIASCMSLIFPSYKNRQRFGRYFALYFTYGRKTFSFQGYFFLSKLNISDKISGINSCTLMDQQFHSNG